MHLRWRMMRQLRRICVPARQPSERRRAGNRQGDVHDQLAMRFGHRAADPAHERHARAHVQARMCAVGGDRDAVDEFHDVVRRAVVLAEPVDRDDVRWWSRAAAFASRSNRRRLVGSRKTVAGRSLIAAKSMTP